MVARGKKGQQRAGDRGHPARGDERRLRILQRGKLLMQHQMIGSIVQANIANGIVTYLAGIFEHRGLKDRHADRTLDARLRLACVDQFGLDTLEVSWHRWTLSFLDAELVSGMNRSKYIKARGKGAEGWKMTNGKWKMRNRSIVAL